MAYLNTHLSTGVSFTGHLAALQHRITARVLRGHMYRQTLNSLSALSNAQLADLGLARSELHSVALESARAAST